MKCTREYRPERRRDRVLSPLPGTDIIPLALYFSVSAEVDDAKLKSFFAAIDGKDVAELIKEGQAKLASVPSGGGGGGGGDGGGGGGGGGAAAAAPEPEEEEEEEVRLKPHPISPTRLTFATRAKSRSPSRWRVLEWIVRMDGTRRILTRPSRREDDPRPRWMICEPALFRLQKPDADPSRPFFSPLQAMDFDLFD